MTDPTPTRAEVDTAMEKMGIDGVIRPTDEHYDTVMDVQEDPTGALWSIHALFERCEALRERAEAAEADLDREMGVRDAAIEMLNEARRAEAAAWNDAIEAVEALEPLGRRWISRARIRALRRAAPTEGEA